MAPPLVSTDYKAIFEATSGLYLVLDSEFRIVAVSDAYLYATTTRSEEILGKRIFELFPDNPNNPAANGVLDLRASLNRVRLFHKGDAMPIQKHEIRRPESEGGGLDERFCCPFNSPVFAADGSLAYIIHRLDDVTEFAQSKAKEVGIRQLVEQSRNLVQTAPAVLNALTV